MFHDHHWDGLIAKKFWSRFRDECQCIETDGKSSLANNASSWVCRFPLEMSSAMSSRWLRRTSAELQKDILPATPRSERRPFLSGPRARGLETSARIT